MKRPVVIVKRKLFRADYAIARVTKACRLPFEISGSREYLVPFIDPDQFVDFYLKVFFCCSRA